jgi:hypothetical protein
MESFAEDLEGESSKNGTHLICFVEEDSGQVTDLARSKCGIHELPLCSVNVTLSTPSPVYRLIVTRSASDFWYTLVRERIHVRAFRSVTSGAGFCVCDR